MLRSRDSNRNSPSSRLRERGHIVRDEIGGHYLYSSFQFDAATAKARTLAAETDPVGPR